jgi:hypothetical protein
MWRSIPAQPNVSLKTWIQCEDHNIVNNTRFICFKISPHTLCLVVSTASCRVQCMNWSVSTTVSLLHNQIWFNIWSNVLHWPEHNKTLLHNLQCSEKYLHRTCLILCEITGQPRDPRANLNTATNTKVPPIKLTATTSKSLNSIEIKFQLFTLTLVYNDKTF